MSLKDFTIKISTLSAKIALAITLILGMNSEKSIASDGKKTCPADFTAPEDLNAELSDSIKAEKSVCMGAYIPMMTNARYTVGFFNTYCEIKKGVAYGFTIRTKNSDVVPQNECERIGGFMQCFLTLKTCFNKNDNTCSAKKTYCKDKRLSTMEYDQDQDPLAATNTDISQ